MLKRNSLVIVRNVLIITAAFSLLLLSMSFVKTCCFIPVDECQTTTVVFDSVIN